LEEEEQFAAPQRSSARRRPTLTGSPLRIAVTKVACRMVKTL
ncbi:hypothetical protein A2U01_0080075, partial [Trifolium medium]|nr:hypothetical protein [Trifolium medium]